MNTEKQQTSETIEDTPAGTWCWHIHHDEPTEILIIPMSERIAFIRAFKPPSEIPIRLKLLRPVKGTLPKALIEAGEAYLTVFNEWKTMGYQRTKWIEKRNIYFNALETYKPEIERLHALECPNCPWNGETLFPYKDSG